MSVISLRRLVFANLLAPYVLVGKIFSCDYAIARECFSKWIAYCFLKFNSLFHSPIVCLVYVLYQIAFCRFLITLNFHVLQYNSCISISETECFASLVLPAGYSLRKGFHIQYYTSHLSENTNRKPEHEHCNRCWYISRINTTSFCFKPCHQQNVNLGFGWFSSFMVSGTCLKMGFAFSRLTIPTKCFYLC